MRLAVVTMVKDAERWLAQTLPAWAEFSDGIIALNDGSTDGTSMLLQSFGAEIIQGDGTAWGAEAAPRRRLFEHAAQSDYTYLFWLDADMCPARSPRPLLESGLPDMVSFRLFDLWSSHLYREDQFWFGHRAPRPWLIRRPADDFQALWEEREIHVGHLPRNLRPTRHFYAPEDYSLLHYAYSSPQLREAKQAQYSAVAEHLTQREIAHALSIGDESPCLKALPFSPQWPLDFSSGPVPESSPTSLQQASAPSNGSVSQRESA